MPAFTNLTKLDVTGVSLFAAFNASWLPQTMQLETLNISRSGLTSIDRFTFLGMARLMTLNMNHNLVVNLAPDAFDGFSSLAELYTDNCSLTSWPTALSRINMNRMRKLSLQYNEFASLPANAFYGLSRLDELRIGNSGITRLDDAAFRDLSSLQWLSLSFLPLRSLSPTIFDGLTSLKQLEFQGISFNDKVALTDRYFQSLIQLQRLSLNGRLASRGFIESWNTSFAARLVLGPAPVLGSCK